MLNLRMILNFIHFFFASVLAAAAQQCKFLNNVMVFSVQALMRRRCVGVIKFSAGFDNAINSYVAQMKSLIRLKCVLKNSLIRLRIHRKQLQSQVSDSVSRFV